MRVFAFFREVLTVLLALVVFFTDEVLPRVLETVPIESFFCVAEVEDFARAGETNQNTMSSN